MDAKIENGDIALKPDGEYVTVSGIEEAVQRVRIAALTNRGSFCYDRSLGVDYDAFSAGESDPVGRLDMLIKEGCAAIAGVDVEVTAYDAQTSTVSVRVTYNGRTAVTEVDISGIL